MDSISKFDLVDKRDFDYNPSDGRLFRRDRYGYRELSTRKRDGYITFMYKGEHFQAHRMAWFIYYGVAPSKEIDHVNHVRWDNRIDNLRDVSRRENARNRSFAISNKSGRTGVTWNKNSECWQVQATISGEKSRYYGCFKEFDDAVLARERAEDELDLHPNHERVRG